MTDIWDTPLEDKPMEGDYPVLEAGTYNFEVIDAEAKEYTPSATSKIGRCAEVTLKLRVEGKIDGKDKDVTVFDRLYSDPKTQWKIVSFAKCIGIWKDGMNIRDIINKCATEIGQCELGINEYNGKKSNRVQKYIEKEKKDDLPF